MIPVRYPVTPIKIGVTLLTIGLLMAMLLARNPILTAFLCFSSLITAVSSTSLKTLLIPNRSTELI